MTLRTRMARRSSRSRGDGVRPRREGSCRDRDLVPEMVDKWNREAEPGVVLPMYEGARVCGHGTVIRRTNITLSLDEREEQRFLRWLDDPAAPLGGPRSALICSWSRARADERLR